jgi:hypothetical protein
MNPIDETLMFFLAIPRPARSDDTASTHRRGGARTSIAQLHTTTRARRGL